MKDGKVVAEIIDGPVLMQIPSDSEIGIYPEFHHTDEQYGWLRDRVRIFQQEGPGGGEPVTLQVNGFRVDVPRETDCDIARPFTEVLRNSVETRMEYRELENGKLETVQRDVPRWHWIIVKEGVNKEELKAKAKKFIEAENAKRVAAWEAERNGDNP